jgi:hypothetical protein
LRRRRRAASAGAGAADDDDFEKAKEEAGGQKMLARFPSERDSQWLPVAATVVGGVFVQSSNGEKEQPAFVARTA